MSINVEIKNQEGFWNGKELCYTFDRPLTLITGLNGSGKTQLLDFINDSYGLASIRQYPIPENTSRISIRYIRNAVVSSFSGFHKLSTISDYLSDYFDTEANELGYRIEANILLEICRAKEYQSRHNESEWEQYKAKKGWEKDPWEKINDIFCSFNLDVRVLFIADPYKRKSYGDIKDIYVRFVKNGTIYSSSDLSTGEKIAYQMALWQFGSMYEKHPKVLLIDEFDAYLNPSLIKNFVGVMYEFFVKKGTQVIMTTHSPSTVAYCEEKDILWMEEGKILHGEQKKSKKEIIYNLSSGLISLDDTIDLLSLLIRSEKKNILFVEGETDKIYLEKAYKALGRQNELESFDIVRYNGSNKIYTLLEILYYHHHLKMWDKKITILCDNDGSGRDIKASSLPTANFNGTKKIIDNAKVIHVPIDEDFSSSYEKQYPSSRGKIAYDIEYLFDYGILEKYKVIKPKLSKDDGSKSLKDALGINQNHKWLYDLNDDKKITFAKSLEERREDFVNFETLLKLINQAFAK